MAGSFSHCLGDDGAFRFDLIENMGDAHEACAMMFHMIMSLSDRDPDRIEAAEAAYYRSVNPQYYKGVGPKKQSLGWDALRRKSGQRTQFELIRDLIESQDLDFRQNHATAILMIVHMLEQK